MLEIKDLHLEVEKTSVLSGLSLSVAPGEVVAIMGPNGAGKSSLAKLLAGHPDYLATKGTVQFCGQNLLDLEPHERSLAGLFVGYQYPVEIPGVTNLEFLHLMHSSHLKHRKEQPLNLTEFKQLALDTLERIGAPQLLLERELNAGLSGGEKKWNEILQMALLKPKLILLDETDSGLDIDAIRGVAAGIQQGLSPDQSLILITHYQRFLNYLPPTRVDILVEGQITETGGPELALELEKTGYLA